MSKKHSINRTIVLTGALFPANYAKALWPEMQNQAPNLCNALQKKHAQVIPLNPLAQRCTAYELYLLRYYGFQPNKEQSDGAGMAAILALQSAVSQKTIINEPFWLAELVHIAPGREGANLIPARLLNIKPEESAALFKSITPYLKGTGFEFNPIHHHFWQVNSSQSLPKHTATTELVYETTVQDWWDTSMAGRPWRQLANEIQMLWFDHPVNIKRRKTNQADINALWLMGGAKMEQLTHLKKQIMKNQEKNKAIRAFSEHQPLLIRELEPAYRQQDWADWLQTLQKIDKKYFTHPFHTLICAGQNGYLMASAQKQPWFKRIFSSKKTGSLCWLNPF